MSLIAKLWGVKRGIKQIGAEVEAFAPTSSPSSSCNDRNFSNFGTDRVRILLFRECEWRGRKLLFDSLAVHRNNRRCSNADNNNATPSYCRRVATKNRRDNDAPDATPCEHGKLLSEDIGQLSEMIYGTVAMTYKGPSFKIHAMSSPGCVMCTKVFPYSEHSVCRQSQRHSNETLGASTNFDSNSSNSSLRTQHSRPGSGNLSGSSLSPTLRKNSTCSSTGSGWDIDVPRLGSSQSLDGSTGLVGGGSLSSLRRRWMRVVSTSLSRSESDDAFGHNYEGSTLDGSEMQSRRHKTRLGLAMLLQLPPGQEQEMSKRLLEHAALLEGMLDRLRHSCVEAIGIERSLVARLYRASSCCTLRLLRLLMTTEAERLQKPTPLLWHDLLLNSVMPVNMQLSTVYRSLQQMCSLLEELDTKSTNFFLSTIVTAVLTHHLGWVHTAPPHRNRQLIEDFGQQYPFNPLWAQLNDLYGALGTPARIAHTVIAGDPEKVNLIDAILNFLSYFLRSGLVEKRQETRCTEQEDVAEAVAILERAMRNNPSLGQPSISNYTSVSGKKGGKFTAKKTSKKLEVTNSETAYPLAKSKSYEEPRKGPSTLEAGLTNGDSSSVKVRSDFDIVKKSESFKCEDQSSTKKLKRSSTLQKTLNEYALSISATELQASTQAEERQAKSKVKIIVSDENEGKLLQKDNELLRTLEKTTGDEEMDQKLALLRRQKLNGLDVADLDSKTLEEQALLLTYGFADDISREVKSQVYFTLGGEEKPSNNVSIRERLKSSCKCQCSYTFTRVPSTSADLPEGVLRKIIQRNFPESSKNMRPTDSCESDFGICFNCRRGYASSSQGFVNGKLLLETPTNATEVLRGCGSSSSTSNARVLGTNSMEALIEANCVIELPMPRSKKVSPLVKRKPNERVGFVNSLLGSKTVVVDERSSNPSPESGYTWGMVVQGFTKRKKKGRRRITEETSKESKVTDSDRIKEEEWWWPIREGLGVEAKFPLVDQPVSEALCIVADLDNWQVGLLSNTSAGSTPVPVGMSRLVSNMLEAFTFMWKEFRSPEQCIKLLESRLREMWLRSETLAEYLLAANLDDASVGNLTSFLDVDAADLPLLLAVATTHSPQITQRFGLTLA
ncbi:folliculin-interacting protein 2 isoform X1 [Nasonia vitripennis]|uniref:UDENN FNIP1/2-type domain-containing protein n=1 Tax=Nasonia vitripennis TaxID=7425 RepID=A0A7M7GES6_NASVI|nr:folliculin-interacting protein 2 isoform X1 [Nasonia vitripennis]